MSTAKPYNKSETATLRYFIGVRLTYDQRHVLESLVLKSRSETMSKIVRMLIDELVREEKKKMLEELLETARSREDKAIERMLKQKLKKLEVETE